MSVSKVLDVPDFRSVGACSDVMRHCTNAANMSHEHDIKHESKVSLDRVSVFAFYAYSVT